MFNIMSNAPPSSQVIPLLPPGFCADNPNLCSAIQSGTEAITELIKALNASDLGELIEIGLEILGDLGEIAKCVLDIINAGLNVAGAAAVSTSGESAAVAMSTSDQLDDGWIINLINDTENLADTVTNLLKEITPVSSVIVPILALLTEMGSSLVELGDAICACATEIV